MPPAGSCSCGDWHSSLHLWETLWVLAGSERGGCNPLLGFELLSDRHPDPAKFAKSFEVWPLQEDLVQQVWHHLLQDLHNTIEWHKKHLSHILICNLLAYDKLATRDLLLSFGNARAQYEQVLQHLSLQNCLSSVLVLMSGSRPAVLPVTYRHSDCHL